MNRLSIIAVTTASLILGVSLAVSSAVGQQNAQLTSDVGGVNAASQAFIAAISARDIDAMDKVWAHQAYATFMGPLSTTIVVGWGAVAAQERRHAELRCLRDERIREPRRPLADGVSPGHANLQGAQIARVCTLKPAIMRRSTS